MVMGIIFSLIAINAATGAAEGVLGGALLSRGPAQVRIVFMSNCPTVFCILLGPVSARCRQTYSRLFLYADYVCGRVLSGVI